MKKNEYIGKTFTAKNEVDYSDGSIVSKELVHNTAGSITLFSFDEGQQLSEHTAPFDAVLEVLEGEALITIEGVKHCIKEGETIIMPANVPHAVIAEQKFKMSLVMIKGK